MRPSVLEPDDRKDQLRRCPLWNDEGGRISRTFKFKTYLKGVAFANALAEIAEEANHHPDILISYRAVEVTLTTHDAGGVTRLDIEMAERADGLVEEK